MKLIAQGEYPTAAPGGAWFGLEVFEDETGKFYVVVHTSMYSGIQRTSHYATQPVLLENAQDAEEATVEANKKARAYVNAVLGQELALQDEV